MTTPTWDQFEDTANRGRTDLPEDFQRTRGYAAHVEVGDLVVLVSEEPEQSVDWEVTRILPEGLVITRKDAVITMALPHSEVIRMGLAHSPRHWIAKAQAIIDKQREDNGE